MRCKSLASVLSVNLINFDIAAGNVLKSMLPIPSGRLKKGYKIPLASHRKIESPSASKALQYSTELNEFS